MLLGLHRLQVSPWLPSPCVPQERGIPAWHSSSAASPTARPSQGRGSSGSEKGTFVSLVFPTTCVFHFSVRIQRILTGSFAALGK